MQQIIFDFGTLGDFHLRVFGYGLMLVLGFLFGIALARWRAKRCGIKPDLIAQMGVVALIGGVLGARVLYVIKNWEDFSGRSIGALFDVSSGGLIYFGGLAGGALTAILYMKLKKMPIRRTLDIIAPTLMLGLAFGRIGCTCNGCCWGGPARDNWAFSITFPMISKPLFRIGDEPYAPDQSLCPSYAEQFWAGRCTPDVRLTNQFENVRRGEDTNSTYRKSIPDPNTTRPRIRPISQMHGKLTHDQMQVMLGTLDNAKKAFNEYCGIDEKMSKHEWDIAIKFARGGAESIGLPLHGSEFWDEAVAAQYHLPAGKFNGETLSFENFWGYLQLRKAKLLARFDANGNLRFEPDEIAAANAWLQESLYAVLAAQRTNALRPAQPLGIVNGLLLCLLLCWFFRHRRAEGHVFALMLMLYPMTRFMLESIRHEQYNNLFLGKWTHNQISSVIMTAAGVALWLLFTHWPKIARWLERNWLKRVMRHVDTAEASNQSDAPEKTV